MEHKKYDEHWAATQKVSTDSVLHSTCIIWEGKKRY